MFSLSYSNVRYYITAMVKKNLLKYYFSMSRCFKKKKKKTLG